MFSDGRSRPPLRENGDHSARMRSSRAKRPTPEWPATRKKSPTVIFDPARCLHRKPDQFQTEGQDQTIRMVAGPHREPGLAIPIGPDVTAGPSALQNLSVLRRIRITVGTKSIHFGLRERTERCRISLSKITESSATCGRLPWWA